MKKLALCSLCLLSYGAVYALPVQNPAEASILTNGIFFAPNCCDTNSPCFTWFDAWSVKVGFYGDYVFNRRLKLRGKGFDRGEGISKTRMCTNAGQLALNICDKIDVFGTVGCTHISINTSDISWAIREGGFESRLDWDTKCSWSAGARGTLIRRSRFALGVEGQYFQTSPDLNSFLDFATGRITYFDHKNNTRYREWQFALGLSYFLSSSCSDITVVPYGAATFSWVRFETRKFTFIDPDLVAFTIFDMKNATVCGLAIGATISFFGRGDITVEGRFIDENAINVTGSIRF